jgi:hypothetical protein
MKAQVTVELVTSLTKTIAILEDSHRNGAYC